MILLWLVAGSLAGALLVPFFLVRMITMLRYGIPKVKQFHAADLVTDRGLLFKLRFRVLANAVAFGLIIWGLSLYVPDSFWLTFVAVGGTLLSFSWEHTGATKDNWQTVCDLAWPYLTDDVKRELVDRAREHDGIRAVLDAERKT